MPRDGGVTRRLQRGRRGNYTISIPSSFVLGFGWKAGDMLAWRITGPGKIELMEWRDPSRFVANLDEMVKEDPHKGQ